MGRKKKNTTILVKVQKTLELGQFYYVYSGIGKWMRGKIIYIHPKERFATLLFETTPLLSEKVNSFTESFFPEQLHTSIPHNISEKEKNALTKLFELHGETPEENEYEEIEIEDDTPEVTVDNVKELEIQKLLQTLLK